MADGSINQLNFEVILNDKDFNSKLQNLQTLANQFNITMSQALTLSKVKATTKDVADLEKAIKGASSAQTTLNQAMNKMPAGKMSQYAQGLKQTNIHLAGATNIMRTLSQLTGVAFGAMGIRRFLSTLIDVTGQFEVQKMALGAMLQDADKADKIFGQFRQLALESPYTFQEFTKFGKQLTAFNIPAEQLVGTTKMLADVAAGLGVDMQRIILAYGQIKSAGVLKGTELRQLTEAGVPILDSLAKQIEKTTGKTVQLAEVFDMISKKQIPFAMVEQAFKDMTSEGGKFYNMQEVLVETLAGKIGKLKDTWQQALYDIGSAQSGLLKGSVDFLTSLIANYDKLGRAIMAIVVSFGAYKAIVFATTLAVRGYTAVQIASRAATLAAAAANRVLNSTLLANPYAFVGAAIIGVTTGLIKFATTTNQLVDATKILKETTEEYQTSLISEQEELKILLERMEKLTPAHEKYTELKERLLNKYGQYLSDVDKENIAIGKLAGVYDTLAVSIEKTAMARARDAGQARLEEQLTEAINDVTKTFNSTIGRNEKNAETRKELLDYIFGRVDKNQLSDKAKKYTETVAYMSSNLVEDLKNMYKNAKTAVEEGEKALDEALGNRKPGTSDNGNWLSNPLEWQKKVGYRMGKSESLWNKYGYKKDESWETYYTRMRGVYNKLSNDIISAESKERRKALTEERKELLALNKEFGGALLAGSKVYNKELREEESEETKKRNKKISDIKKDIEILKKYKETYDSFKDLLGEEGAQEITNKIYKDVDITNFDFSAQIVEMAEAIRALGDATTADSILASLGLGEGKDLEAELKKVQQIAKEYKGLMEAWDAKDMDADEDTFFGRITKIVSDLNTKLNELNLKGDKAKELLQGIDISDPNQKQAVIKALMDEGMAKDAAEQFWDAWVEAGPFAIDRLVTENGNKLIKLAQQSINAEAKNYVKDRTSSMSLTDWGDKSIGQVYRIWKDIEKIAGEDVQFDDKLKEKIYKAGLTLKDFRKMTAEEFQKLQGEVREEFLKKVAASLKQLKSDLDSTAQAVKEFADEVGNEALGDLVESFMELSDIATNVLERALQGDWIGATVSFLTSVANGFLEAATASAKFKRELVEAQKESKRLQFEESLSNGVSSIWGKDSAKELNNAVNGLNQTKKAMEDLNKTMPKEFQSKKNFWVRALKGGISLAGLAIGSQIDKYTEYSLKEMADSLGRDLYDEYNNLNAKTLQAILDKYDKLKQSDKDWISQAIDYSEEYAEAMEQLDDVIEAIIGDIASAAADTIVDGWIEAGKAALDYADILDDVAQSYSKMLVKSMIFDSLEENTEAIKKAFAGNDYQTAMSLISDAMAQIEEMAPGIEEILSAFDPYYKREESERTASSKGLVSNFSQDTIDYWSGQLTLLVQYARRGDEQREAITNLVMALRDNMGGGGNGDYTSNVQTYLATIQGDTTAIRGDIYAMKLAIQNMNDKGVKML